MSLNNFRANVNILTKFFRTTCREAGLITRVQLLEGPPPKFPRAKITSKFGRDFWQLSTLIANISISPELIDISNIWKKLYQPLPLPRWAKENWWTLVHKQKSFNGSEWPTQIDIFSGDYISVITRCCHLKFLHWLQTNPGYLAHPPTGTGVPPKKLIAKI